MVGGNHSGTYSIGHFHFLKHLQVPLLSSQVGWMWLDVKIVIKTEGGPFASLNLLWLIYTSIKMLRFFLLSLCSLKNSLKMDYSNYLLLLLSPLAHNMIFQKRWFDISIPSRTWEDHGTWHPGIRRQLTKTLGPLLPLLPAQVPSHSRPWCHHLWDEECD